MDGSWGSVDGDGGLGVLGRRIEIEGRGVYSVQEEPTHNGIVIACFRRGNAACVHMHMRRTKWLQSHLANLCACIELN